MDIRAPGYSGTETFGHWDTRAPGYSGTKTFGHQDIRAPLSTGIFRLFCENFFHVSIFFDISLRAWLPLLNLWRRFQIRDDLFFIATDEPTSTIRIQRSIQDGNFIDVLRKARIAQVELKFKANGMYVLMEPDSSEDDIGMQSTVVC
jgi:hypothetical protein